MNKDTTPITELVKEAKIAISKDEVIKEAWEKFYSNEVDKNGWLDIKFKSDEINFPITILYEKDITGRRIRKSHFRPTSLQGIENNNGWLSDLSKLTSSFNCHFIFNNTRYKGAWNGLHFIGKSNLKNEVVTLKSEEITHYKIRKHLKLPFFTPCTKT